MRVKTSSSPFGSLSRTRILAALELMSESYPRELARVLDMPLSTVQKALLSLERDGLVAGRSAGRTRLFRISPRYFAREALRRLVAAVAGRDEELVARVSGLRRRPRRTGKPL